MGYYRKLINGIILIIIGISSIGISSWLYDQATIGLSYCNSFGDIGYLLFEDCNTASIVSSATLIDLLIGSLMILAGIILLIVGIVKGKKPDFKNHAFEQNNKEKKLNISMHPLS